ncbi:MAG: 16S rRNA (cytidine(1402)-2'-O)-methyltransferase [Atopobiaceae bacterium]|nr:16S rRNA (cytidine(1402)-2'-O)-methyltransferase [Atopobiaceae bacterium]
MAGGEAQGLLSVVGTPIGNLSDASPRVVDTLRSSSVILCEDTRVTSRLLAHFGIHVPLQRADENVLARRLESTLERLAAGEHVSFVSDAGMPGVSDPGQRLVDAALDAGMRVEVVPGPSAVTCALVASGLPMEHFFFEGFLPRKHGAIVTRLRELASIPGALVFYESPRRVVATLQAMAEVFPLRRVALVRELTKLHEEVVRGISVQVAAEVAQRDEVKGECVLVLEGPVAQEGHDSTHEAQPVSLDDAILEALAAGEPKSAVAKRLSRELGRPRSEVYDRVVELARG